ncbi:hypothetical protein CC78DRAFT_346193 [Lojkania enalia]|uniref:Uncharacterized protein n=1 Tax=Lojkania enalia TaxID=147567 RepID=A0A9P4K4Y0_9PLEO|nr:hypothetical protein CC78DRAFT_346193 [Didymosphaeria enalia]
MPVSGLPHQAPHCTASADHDAHQCFFLSGPLPSRKMWLHPAITTACLFEDKQTLIRFCLGIAACLLLLCARVQSGRPPWGLVFGGSRPKASHSSNASPSWSCKSRRVPSGKLIFKRTSKRKRS